MKSPALQQQVASVQLAMHVCPVTTPSPHCQRSLRCLGDLGDVLVSHETFPSSWLGLPQLNVVSTRSVKLYLPGRMDIQHKLKQSRLTSQLYVGLGPMAFCTALTCYSTSLRSINNSNPIFGHSVSDLLKAVSPNGSPCHMCVTHPGHLGMQKCMVSQYR